GPIWKQVKDVLDYIKTTVIEEKVVKIKNRAEAERYYNYPYNALEEAIVNAVFHKSYREDSPVEVRIYVNEIKILNYPGPAKWIDMKKFVSGKVRARKYRNRRIGEFFKEIDLSERQSTGIPTILSELSNNGSPIPEFDTDDDRNYLETTIKIHEGFEITVDSNQKNERSLSEVLSEVLSKKNYEKVLPIIEYLMDKEMITPKKTEEIIDKSPATARRYMKILFDTGFFETKGSTNNLVYVIKGK
ncbi:MAG: ATP-binding protein, partial [Clostridium sp.]